MVKRTRKIRKMRRSGGNYKGMGKHDYMAWVRSHRKKWKFFIYLKNLLYILYVFLYIFLIIIKKLFFNKKKQIYKKINIMAVKGRRRLKVVDI